MKNPNTKPEPVKRVITYRYRDNNGTTETSSKTTDYKETILLLLKIMATIFLCEAAIMFLLYVFPLSRHWSILLDPVMLTILGTPALYFLLFRPICRTLENRKEAEQELLMYQKQLKSLASQLSLTEDRERHRLATGLHDLIGQSLILCNIKLDHLRIHGPPGELSESLHEICDDLREIVQYTRNLISDLSCPILYELGFEAAVEEWLTNEIQQKHGIETEFFDDKQAKPLDYDLRMILFRNVRELLANVIEHASANKVKVSINRAGDNINICIEDDGVGFDPAKVEALTGKHAGFGLFGIRERMEQAGGLIEIASEPGSGTIISMTVPIRKKVTDNASRIA